MLALRNLFLVIFAMLCFQALAQNEVKEAESSLHFDKLEHNFGQIPQGVPATYEFTFKNTGKKPVQIAEVRTSCGCTTPFYTKEPVAPKKSGVVKVSYNAATAGNFTKSVSILTSEGKTIYLTIRGTVVPAEQ